MDIKKVRWNAGDPSSNLGGPITKKTPYKDRREKMTRMTRFEKARLIGARALQLAMGAKPLVKIPETKDPIDIATLELKKSVIPLTVRK